MSDDVLTRNNMGKYYLTEFKTGTRSWLPSGVVFVERQKEKWSLLDYKFYFSHLKKKKKISGT